MFHRHHAGWQLAALSWTLLLVLPALAHGQAVTAAWDPSPPGDQVTGYQVCVGTSSLSCNVALAPVGASTTTYRFTPAGGTFYYVATRATNAAGASPYSSEVRFSIPSFGQPASLTTVAGATVSLNLSITDPDGSPLSITHTGLPPGLSINSSTRRISGAPAAAGTYNVTLFANDGLVTVARSFVWTITPAPVPDTVAPSLVITNYTTGMTVYTSTVTIAGVASDSGSGGAGVTSVTINGAGISGATATGNDTTYWSRMIPLSVGVNTISVQARDAAGNQATQQISLTRTTQACRTIGDLNGDCKADLIWHNNANGQNVVWFLNGTATNGYAVLKSVADPNWQLVASGDINNDGGTDLIWRHRTNGNNIVWYLNGTTIVGELSLTPVADPDWLIVACADVNRDGTADLIWRHRVTGNNVVWYLSGTTIVGVVSLPQVADPYWQIVASADINRDGTADLIWRNPGNGANVVWYLNDGEVIGAEWLPTVTGWRLAAALDIDNDGATELIWRNDSGENYAWYMSQATVTVGGWLPALSDKNWQVVGR